MYMCISLIRLLTTAFSQCGLRPQPAFAVRGTCPAWLMRSVRRLATTMFKAFVTSPFFRIGGCRLVEFQTVTANPDFRLVDYFHPFAFVIFVARDLRRRTCAALIVSAVVAVCVHRLTFQSFSLFASGFAVFVTQELNALPV